MNIVMGLGWVCYQVVTCRTLDGAEVCFVGFILLSFTW